MTVRELYNILGTLPYDMPVVATWESVFRDIKEKNIYVSPDGYLIIDADYNSYKKRILEGKNKVWVAPEPYDDEEDE